MNLAELASRFDAKLRGDPQHVVSGVASLASAGPEHVAFLANSAWRARLRTTTAGAVILTEDDARDYPGNALIHDNPHLCFARVADVFRPEPAIAPGIHPSAVVDPRARSAASATVGPHSVIEAEAEIGESVYVGPGCFVGAGARLGAGTRLTANVTVAHDCVLGERWVTVPQLGRVVIGNDVDVGANTTIDRGALDDTVIADGVKLDNLIQIAHNVQIGEHTAMAGCVGVAGSAVIGKRCMIGGGAGIAGHLTIVDDVHVTGTSLISGSVAQAGIYSSAISAEEAARWRRNAARLRHLDELARRVQAMEEKLERLIEGNNLE
ncbi:MAG TPA: UDP-3-O-(3-hydroxymyristoyl)glucosamine N-acyltransferase [Acidiferrobacterales bacterium]